MHYQIKPKKKEMPKTVTVRIFLVIVFNFLMGGSIVMAQSYGLHTSDQIEFTKQMVKAKKEPWYSANNKLISKADQALRKRHQAQRKLINYNIYNATKEQQKSNIITQEKLYADANNAYALALAYKLTNNVKYANKAIYFINAWASIHKKYEGAGYNQAFGDGTTKTATRWLISHGYKSFQKYKLPDYYNQSSAELHLITSGNGFLLAAILLKDYKGWSSTDKNKFRSWLTNVFQEQGTDNMLDNNDFIYGNPGSWALFGKIAHHAWLGDTAKLQKDVSMLKDTLNHQLEPFTDGGRNIPHMWPVEVRRKSKGAWYTYFTMTSLTTSMMILNNELNINLFKWKNKHGSSMEDALNKYFYYVKDYRRWERDTGYKLSTASYRPTPDNWAGVIFEAMWPVYNKTDWKNWADKARPIQFFTSHTAWCVPTLFRPDLTQTNSQDNNSQTSNEAIFIMDSAGLH